MDQFTLLLFASLIIGMSKGGLASAGALAVPILSIWMNPLVAVGWLLPIFLISDCVGVYLYRRAYSLKNVALLIPAGVLGVGLATVLAPYISATIATGVTGLIGLIYCLQVWIKQARKQDGQKPFHLVKGVFWGILTGISSFISHTGAPPYQSFVLPQKLPKMEFAGTTVLVFAAVNFSKLPAYIYAGMISPIEWSITLPMALIAAVGALIGRAVSIWLPERIFFLVIQILLFIVSVYLLVKTAMQIW